MQGSLKRTDVLLYMYCNDYMYIRDKSIEYSFYLLV